MYTRVQIELEIMDNSFMGNIIRKIFALFVAFIVAGIIVNVGRFLGPIIAGTIIGIFDIAPGGPNGARLLEAVGNIVLVFIILPVSIKVYKRMTRVKKGKEE
jgi:hypothetical protein